MPDGVAADSSQIQTFLEEIVGMQSTPLKQDAAPNWSEFGLDKPDHSYQFKLKDGKTVSLDIGQQNPGAYARYARKDNAPPAAAARQYRRQIADRENAVRPARQAHPARQDG